MKTAKLFLNGGGMNDTICIVRALWEKYNYNRDRLCTRAGAVFRACGRLPARYSALDCIVYFRNRGGRYKCIGEHVTKYPGG